LLSWYGSLTPKVLRTEAVLVLALTTTYFLAGNLILERGVLGVPTSAVFIQNYDDLERTVSWEMLKSKYHNLDPAAMEERASVLIVFQESWKSLLYGNNEVSFVSNVWSTSVDANYRVLFPFVLVLVLDLQDNIRGKLLSPIQTNENSLSFSSAEFWFSFPTDMRGAKYTIIVELLAYWVFVCCGPVYQISGIEFTKDDYYGLLPQAFLQGGTSYKLLAFARSFREAPPPVLDMRLAYSYASISTAFLSVLTIVLISLRKKIASFLRENLRTLALFWISVILFTVMIFLIAILK